MIFTYWKDAESNNLNYLLSIPLSGIIKVKLSEWDKALFLECDKSDKISDNLLALELLCRRVEETNA